MTATLEELKPETVTPILDGQFADFGWRPVFKEHERDGYSFDEAAMRRIAENCNDRIRDTGDFPVVAIRHNGKVEDPEVIGFAGPFVVRKFGNEQPVWSIYAKIRTYAEDAHKLKKYPRLSVQYWAPKTDPLNGYFDPISVLGSEPAELDLGIRYAKTSDGLVLQYQMSVEYEASPAGGGPNTFVPSTGDDEKPKQYTKEPTLALSPEDIQQIVSALEPVIKETCRAEVAASMSTPDENVVPGEPVPDENPDETKSPEEVEKVDEGDEKPLDYQADNPTSGPEAAEHAEDEPMEYSKGNDQHSVVQYQKLQLDHEQLQSQYQKAKSELDSIRQEARVATRRQVLGELADGHVFDVDEEMEFVSNFTDEQFNMHVTRIPTHYQKVARSFLPIPRAKIDRRTDDQERKSRVSNRAMAIATNYQREGRHVEYAKCLQEAEAELKKETA